MRTVNLEEGGTIQVLDESNLAPSSKLIVRAEGAGKILGPIVQQIRVPHLVESIQWANIEKGDLGSLPWIWNGRISATKCMLPTKIPVHLEESTIELEIFPCYWGGIYLQRTESNNPIEHLNSITPIFEEYRPIFPGSFDDHERVVYSSLESPILVSYNTKTSKHSIWLQSKVVDNQPMQQLPSFQSILDNPPEGPKRRLSHLLTEEQSRPQSSTIFICHDENDDIHLCLHNSNTLRCYLVDTKQSSSKFRFELPALSAQPVIATRQLALTDENDTHKQNRCDLLIVDLDGNLELYCGPNRICYWYATDEIFEGNSTLKACRSKPSSTKKGVVKILSIAGANGNRVTVVTEQGSISVTLCAVPTSRLVCDALRAISCQTNFSLSCDLLGVFLEQKSTGGTTLGEWDIFTSILISLIGTDGPAKESPRKSSEDEDWNFLLDSNFHKTYNGNIFTQCLATSSGNMYGTSPNLVATTKVTAPNDMSTKLTEQLSTIFLGLHLLYEDYKLNVLLWPSLHILSRFLVQLSARLGWSLHTDYYSRDNPSTAPNISPSQSPNSKEPAIPNIHEWLLRSISGDTTKFPATLDSKSPYERTRQMCRFYSIWNRIDQTYQPLHRLSTWLSTLHAAKETPPMHVGSETPMQERLLKAMIEEGFHLEDLDCTPVGVVLPLREAIRWCREHPPFDLPKEGFTLIRREDMSFQTDVNVRSPLSLGSHQSQQNKSTKSVQYDGVQLESDVTQLRFSKDFRLVEVQKLLASSRLLPIKVASTAGLSDHELVAAQQAQLVLLAKRTLALPVGRGMFTLAVAEPLLTETIPIPPMVLNGRVVNTKTTVSMETSMVPPELLQWPEFHNGVAAGLRISPHQAQITSTWIVYNKSGEVSNSHAGLLMALGLHGHLASLALTKVFDYMSSGQEITTISLLLGMAATKRGTMDAGVAKLLSIHVPSLHPPSSTDLEVPCNVQTAAVLGIGLLYQSTAHRRMAELLIGEIGRKPEDNNQYRESYSLAAGLALGFITLGRGSNAVGLTDLRIEDKLSRYITGGEAQSNDMNQSRSFLVMEGNKVNVDVTAPGAILALGLMFLKTNNKAIASRLSVPRTRFLLDYVRSDFLLLRALCKNFILWDSIRATDEWLAEQMPDFIKKDISSTDGPKSSSDLQLIRQAHMNILSGSCFAIGLRYAGSAYKGAFDLLMRYVNYFKDVRKKASDEDHFAAESCLNITAISLSLVMAGTGNLDVLRVLRSLSKRTNGDLSYGNHMALNMAIGFLFMGGGRYSLSTSNTAIAALVCSLYPQFPLTSNDNRYHLQAFRHLYVLAAEPRCIEVRDADSGQLTYAGLEVTLKETPMHQETTLNYVAPCILPELHQIKKIVINSPRYWSQVITLDSQHPLLSSSSKVIYVKRKTGYLHYIEDPQGFRSILSRSFPKHLKFTTAPRGNQQSKQMDFIKSFSADPNMLAFARHFCNDQNDTASSSDSLYSFDTFATSVLYECLTHEKPEILQTYLILYQFANKMVETANPLLVWNIKLAISFYSNHVIEDPLLQTSFIKLLETRLDSLFAEMGFENNQQALLHYTQTGCLPTFPPNSVKPSLYTADRQRHLFAFFLVYNGIPLAKTLAQMHQDIKSQIQQHSIPISTPFLLVMLLQACPQWNLNGNYPSLIKVENVMRSLLDSVSPR